MKVNKNTQKAQNWIDSYESSDDYIITWGDIYKVYDRPSQNKVSSLYRHICRINEAGGYSIKILSHNSQSYVLGYLTEKDNNEILKD